MELNIIKLLCIFLVIVIFLKWNRPLYQAVLAGIIMTAFCYGISFVQCVKLVLQVSTNRSSLSILIILYMVTLLQKLLEKRQQLQMAQQDLNAIFNNRRVNATAAPLFIGLLPSAAAMILCGDIVKESTDGFLSRQEQAFVTSWFRHIPESSLPTYASVLLLSTLSGLPIPAFILGMVVPMICLFLLAYIPYIRKLPKDTGTLPGKTPLKNFWHLIGHLWTLLAILFLILAFQLSVITSVGTVIVLSVIIYRFTWPELKPIFPKAVEKRMLGNTFLVLIFKEFILHTGIIYELPEYLAWLPVPVYLVFALLFFFGCILIGASGIIALGTVMAFSAVPDAGLPLMVLLMCVCHAGSQLSPTHVCLVVASEYYGIPIGDLIKKTFPASLIFCILMIGYYHLLLLIC